MIETENTPNPDTLKFLPGKTVSEIGPVEFLKGDNTTKVSLAKKILLLEGTTMVFFGKDFITVKKEKDFLSKTTDFLPTSRLRAAPFL